MKTYRIRPETNHCAGVFKISWHAAFPVRTILAIFCLAIVATPATAAPPQSAIASAHPLATQAGFEILRQGGNAFDAAVAVSAALAVVEPAGSGLGGGGFWLLRRPDGKEIMVDGRERAPLAASANMYLDESGAIVPERSIDGPLAAAIPGMPAGLVHLAEHYGRLPLATLLAPAIRYAEAGFPVGERHIRLLSSRAGVLRRYSSAAAVFLPMGKVPEPGDRLVQKDLAETLRKIALLGKAGFHGGETARILAEGVHSAGGIWTTEDLAEYRIVEREPIHGYYRGIRITTAAPPSAGGIGLVEMLNVLSAYELDRLPEITRKHLIVEAMRRAYHDREQHLGDPDFVGMPVLRLLSPNYAAGLRSTLRLDRALPSAFLSQPIAPEPVGDHTTHFSILDKEGNAVAATLSINYPFGSGFMVPGTGVLLNDEMDDFSAKPGSPNVYGLVGGVANAIAPGKRMLSSMTPTFLDDGARLGLLGTPGGSRIVSMVLLAALDFAKGNGPESWTSVPRFHHQYLPDVIEYETGGLTPAEQDGLRHLGHALQTLNRNYGDMQAIVWERNANRVRAASDPRGAGSARVE